MHCSTEFAKQVLPKFFKPAPTILPDVACELEIAHCAHVRGVALAEVKGHTYLVSGSVPYKGYKRSKFIPVSSR